MDPCTANLSSKACATASGVRHCRPTAPNCNHGTKNHASISGARWWPHPPKTPTLTSLRSLEPAPHGTHGACNRRRRACGCCGRRPFPLGPRPPATAPLLCRPSGGRAPIGRPPRCRGRLGGAAAPGACGPRVVGRRQCRCGLLTLRPGAGPGQCAVGGNCCTMARPASACYVHRAP